MIHLITLIPHIYHDPPHLPAAGPERPEPWAVLNRAAKESLLHILPFGGVSWGARVLKGCVACATLGDCERKERTE